MPNSKIDFDSVRKIALALPEVEESTTYGSPALKVRGCLIACIPTHKSAKPGSLAVSVDFDRRAELLAADPNVYYVKDHYLNYPIVLVRLSRIHRDALQDVLGMAWRFATSKTQRRKRAVRERSEVKARKV
ncbi:MAG: MmcQ/YjbR family DNA-binding protein [Bryobacteraceae bacterium]